MTDRGTEIERVALLHDLSMIGLEYASKGLERQAATITAAISAMSSEDEVRRWALKELDDEISALTAAHELMQETNENNEAQELYIKIEALTDFRSHLANRTPNPCGQGDGQ